MRGESTMHVLGECFVLGVGRAISVFEHREPPGFVDEPPIFVCKLEAALRRLAVEPFRPYLFLDDFPGQFKTELKALDGGIPVEVCFWSHEGFVQAHDRMAETISSCGHMRTP